MPDSPAALSHLEHAPRPSLRSLHRWYPHQPRTYCRLVSRSGLLVWLWQLRHNSLTFVLNRSTLSGSDVTHAVMEEVKGYQPHRTEHLHIQRIEIDDRVERLQWPTLSLYMTGQRQPSYERGKLLVLTPGRADPFRRPGAEGRRKVSGVQRPRVRTGR